MKKSAALLFLILFCNFCSLFKAKVLPYPSGVIFPVAEDHEVSYEGEIISRIQKKDHLLYFSTRKGKVYCLDGENREIVWQFDCLVPLVCPPYLSENRIYVYDRDKFLYCLGRDGKLLWKTELPNKLTSGIAVSGARVYVGSDKGLLFCLNAENGKEVWQFQAGGAIQSNLVIWRDMVLFGSDDHHVYTVDERGKLQKKHDAGEKVGPTLTVDDNLLFFGTENRYLYCLNLHRHKIKWKIHSGGTTFVPPVVAGNRVFFLCWNCVLYCINKKNGTILWWNSVPSRSYYRVEVIEKKVVASSFSSELVCFDTRTGENRGSYNASGELKSNPVWLAPFLTISLYDRESDTGKLVFLKKVVMVTLASSKMSPHNKNDEIMFTARVSGFHLPKFEFFLTRFIAARFYPDIFFLFREGDRTVVQEKSESSTWNWFPQEEGYYRVEVAVEDEREKARAEFPFLIQEETIAVSLSSSLASPQAVGQEITFTAGIAGFVAPRFEFRLGRLKWRRVPGKFSFLFIEKEEVVRVLSEESSWTWSPEAEGLYVIVVAVEEGQDKATARKIFAIKKE